MLAHYDPQSEDNGGGASAQSMSFVRVSGVLAHDAFAAVKSRSTAHGSESCQLLWMLTEDPDPRQREALDQYVLLLAEHELNVYLYARVIASTGSDLHSAITARWAL
jgi:citrate synthase